MDANLSPQRTTASLGILCVAAIVFACLSGLPSFAGANDVQSVRDLVRKPFEARIVAVIDGDTVEAVRDGERLTIRVRLEGIDAPERGEPYSQESRRLTRSLLFDQRVRIDATDVDRYGRLVARVRIGARDTSVELLEAGLACHFTNYSHDQMLARAQASARAAGRGFWEASASKPRCVRTSGLAAPSNQSPKEALSLGNGQIHGNTSSRVYHASWCPNFRCKNCAAVFTSEREASAAGFRPAQDCLKRK